jgi:hypothetical protein
MYQLFNRQLRLPDRPMKRFAGHLTETLDTYRWGRRVKAGGAMHEN